MEALDGEELAKETEEGGAVSLVDRFHTSVLSRSLIYTRSQITRYTNT